MSNAQADDRIDDVAPGDIIGVDRGSGDQPYKVVHKQTDDSGFIVTFEDDDGETFQQTIAAGTKVTRALESKWESTQSPTPHTESGSGTGE
jgi:hypothetical protein